MRPEFDNIFFYRTELTKVSKLPIYILCTSGRNVQDKEELEPLCHKGMTMQKIYYLKTLQSRDRNV